MDPSIFRKKMHQRSESDNFSKKYKSFFRPAKYIIPAAVIALLMGSCGPGADAGDTGDDGTGDGTGDGTTDPATIIDVPSFKAPMELDISWSTSGGNYSIFHPALADMDGDGDLDIIAGYKKVIPHATSSSYDKDSQGLVYLKNTTSTDSELNFTHDDTSLTGFPVDSLYAFQGDAVGAMIPAIGDIDGDLDLDLVIARNYNTNGDGAMPAVKMYIAKNNSNAFVNTPSSLGGSSYSQLHNAPAFTYYDDDSDIDLVTGKGHVYMSYSSSMSYVGKNKITWTTNGGDGDFSFTTSTGDIVEYPEDLNVTKFRIPSFADIDNDGDQDMFTVNYNSGAVTFYLNIGSSAMPDFEEQSSAFSVLPTDVHYFPAFGDMDGDGDLDVIAGSNNGKMWYIENTDIDLQ